MIHSDLMDIYISAFLIYKRMGEIDTAEKYMELAKYHKEEYERVRKTEEFCYSADIFSSIKYKGSELPEYTMADFEDWVKGL